MSSINRPLAGPVLAFDLDEQIAALQGEEPYGRSGRAGRTLAKSGRFRLVLTAMKKGNEIGTHQADSPMTLQVVQGALRFRTNGEEYTLNARARCCSLAPARRTTSAPRKTARCCSPSPPSATTTARKRRWRPRERVSGK